MLSADNHRSLLIPEGFAHGFQTLQQDCELLYLHTAAYDPECEGGLDCLDERIGIPWPLPVGSRSARDQGLPRVAPAFEGITLV
jgi:dTDP-4-dehydrorhamnose 3,5-epimerase